MRHFRTILLAALLSVSLTATAALSANEAQARRIFDKTYSMVFGPQGCTLSYHVNIIGLYKTTGTIWYKGKKQKFIEKRYASWCDGRSFYKVDTKKQTIELHDPNSPNRDKYASKFAFHPDNYTYHVRGQKLYYEVTLDAKDGVSGYIKHVKALIDGRTYAPVSLKIKVALFWTTIKISNFHSGNIGDDIFTFPRQQFAGYKFTDKRTE